MDCNGRLPGVSDFFEYLLHEIVFTKRHSVCVRILMLHSLKKDALFPNRLFFLQNKLECKKHSLKNVYYS